MIGEMVILFTVSLVSLVRRSSRSRSSYLTDTTHSEALSLLPKGKENYRKDDGLNQNKPDGNTVYRTSLRLGVH